jgi:hypothetical protein
MKYGIVIIALGYPLYGNCAFNLALSIKNKCPDVEIALVYEDLSISKLSERELGFFDLFVKLDEKHYTVNGKKQYQRAKLCLDIITNKLGWSHTVYMDADNLWLDRPFDWLFGELVKRDFYIGYNGEYNAVTHQKTSINYTYWPRTNEKEICRYHGIKNTLPQTVSGFVYFKNGEKANEIFKKARGVYDDPNAPTITWAGGKPDEYCMNVALGLIDYKQDKAHIFYFDKINNTIPDETIGKKYWGFATGGNAVSPKLVHLFNRTVNDLCIANNIPTRHYHVDKKDIIEERKAF